MDKEITYANELMFSLIALLVNWVLYKNFGWDKFWGLGKINKLDLVLPITLWSYCLKVYRLINNLAIRAENSSKGIRSWMLDLCLIWLKYPSLMLVWILAHIKLVNWKAKLLRSETKLIWTWEIFSLNYDTNG